MDFQFEGLDELIREIEWLEQVPGRVRNRALKRAGDLLKDQMKSEVYAHGLTRRSGDAQDSIIRTDPRNGELFVGTRGGAKVEGYYLYMHEFGFYNVRAKRFIAPKPFASIAFEMSKGKILDIYVEELRKEMRM
ncbi:phage protein, HK97 gp10 family [Oceanobacillus picturae]|uniref:Phage protein, HK97 gp10 family n=1 Tax=Oceanobacillus picturae TaxID=171693 RepID=W9B9C7_9BACI|nr:HK97-gp10 family putative phage morphogenesis protein [Oceanobacillus picturae]CDO03100.1 phage protein, HK97 gp10 family [Oceanobacillus picturae]